MAAENPILMEEAPRLVNQTPASEIKRCESMTEIEDQNEEEVVEEAVYSSKDGSLLGFEKKEEE